MIHKKYMTSSFFKSSNTGPLRSGAEQYKSIASRTETDWQNDTAKKVQLKYTGENLVGVATMHKSNAVPITRNSTMAIDVAKMRRG